MLEDRYKEDSETLVTDAKYGFISGALKETYKASQFKRKEKTETEIIDTFITHKIFGFPIFLFFLWLMFLATFKLGQYPQNWIESFVAFSGNGLNSIFPDSLLKDLFVNTLAHHHSGCYTFTSIRRYHIL